MTGRRQSEAQVKSLEGAGESLLDGWSARDAGKPRKRSLAIAGHRTSISLEEPFWQALHAIAGEKRVPVARLVCEIDAVRGKTSLSSAIRLFVLDSTRRNARGSAEWVP